MEYGIVANVVEADRVLRLGAKAWIVYWYSGGERIKWIALSRGGRMVEKVSPTWRFKNFRCKWIPEHLRKQIHETGSKEQMQAQALIWEARAEEARGDHPNRKFQTPGAASSNG